MQALDKTVVPFKGDFKELKKLGYAFHKVFARNYKMYSKTIQGKEIAVWVAHGGYVECCDLFSLSYLVIDLIRNHSTLVLPVYKSVMIQGRKVDFSTIKFMINLKTHAVEAYDMRKHNFTNVLIEKYGAENVGSATEQESDLFYATYREVLLTEEFVAEIRTLIKKGMI